VVRLFWIISEPVTESLAAFIKGVVGHVFENKILDILVHAISSSDLLQFLINPNEVIQGKVLTFLKERDRDLTLH
jgi:hypothetical protein